ncbi:hypothetical protein J437_LFUL018328 [Ladona fulva]|uniref:Transposable element P transposase-like RNase H domain-containing protein n=1 Tax=Ladona fulva TaxID=123851 RepID=A0A8K0KN77_LADFU|nr:hypothetical protein J437_LFUL018328 [Ladona fulva]
MSELDKHCVLLFDEMSIKPSFAFNSRSDCIDGFEDHGTLEAEATPGVILVDLIREVLGALQSTGLKIAANVCDMGMAPMETSVTKSFLCFIHDLFQSLNGVKSEGDRVGLKSCVQGSSPHLEFLGSAAQEFKDWEFMKEGRKIKPRSWKGWAIAIEAAKQLWVKLKEAGLSYLEPR